MLRTMTGLEPKPGQAAPVREGKAGHIRTVPIPSWVKAAIDVWTTHAGITEGRVFRAINKAGKVWGDGMTPKVILMVAGA